MLVYREVCAGIDENIGKYLCIKQILGSLGSGRIETASDLRPRAPVSVCTLVSKTTDIMRHPHWGEGSPGN